ncbi:MAG: Sir2 family NAD-dependent protein deacetylase [Bacteroidales bacterium]|nr:Sir2 family NAD-dependent protein deacetylase [Bacteroidales bacterium]
MMKTIVVLTGAGISQESGIKIFRDSDGLWENHRVEDVATYDAWRKNPDLVRDFYNQRRRELYNVEPNEGHKQLLRLEKHFNLQIITQNVDDLHERAGCKNVLHLHGELKKVCSEVDPEDIRVLNGWELTENMKDNYGKPLRPYIVWFGESVPNIVPAIELCEKADIMIIIGTSLNVYPAAGLLNYTKKECKKYLVDPNTVNNNDKNIVFVKQKAGIGVKQVVDEILENYL